jgi:hypothetical protein
MTTANLAAATSAVARYRSLAPLANAEAALCSMT